MRDVITYAEAVASGEYGRTPIRNCVVVRPDPLADRIVRLSIRLLSAYTDKRKKD